MPHWALYLMLVVTALIAGIQNALAGGGSFITFPALLFFGMGDFLSPLISLSSSTPPICSPECIVKTTPAEPSAIR